MEKSQEAVVPTPVPDVRAAAAVLSEAIPAVAAVISDIVPAFTTDVTANVPPPAPCEDLLLELLNFNVPLPPAVVVTDEAIPAIAKSDVVGSVRRRWRPKTTPHVAPQPEAVHPPPMVIHAPPPPPSVAAMSPCMMPAGPIYYVPGPQWRPSQIHVAPRQRVLDTPQLFIGPIWRPQHLPVSTAMPTNIGRAAWRPSPVPFGTSLPTRILGPIGSVGRPTVPSVAVAMPAVVTQAVVSEPTPVVPAVVPAAIVPTNPIRRFRRRLAVPAVPVAAAVATADVLPAAESRIRPRTNESEAEPPSKVTSEP